ncbi:unnamed protein product, partial [Amoebophrya sp. A25]
IYSSHPAPEEVTSKLLEKAHKTTEKGVFENIQRYMLQEKFQKLGDAERKLQLTDDDFGVLEVLESASGNEEELEARIAHENQPGSKENAQPPPDRASTDGEASEVRVPAPGGLQEIVNAIARTDREIQSLTSLTLAPDEEKQEDVPGHAKTEQTTDTKNDTAGLVADDVSRRLEFFDEDEAKNATTRQPPVPEKL